MFKHQHLQIFGLKLKNMSNFHPLEVLGRVSDVQLRVGDNLNRIISGEGLIYRLNVGQPSAIIKSTLGCSIVSAGIQMHRVKYINDAEIFLRCI